VSIIDENLTGLNYWRWR